MPGNSKKNGKPVGEGKNQVALENGTQGTFQEVHSPKNATVLGTNGNVTVSGADLNLVDQTNPGLIQQIAGALDGYNEDQVRDALASIGVYDKGADTTDLTDDTATIGDVVDLGDGNDVMWGDDDQPDGDGNDIILGGDGNDQLRGDGGNDALFGEVGNDVLRGDAGDDYLDGGAGNDVLDGGAGDDNMVGGTGDDVYHVDDLLDTVVELEGEGEDTAIIGAAFDTNSDGTIELGAEFGKMANVEKYQLGKGLTGLVGTADADHLIGNDDDNTIMGGDGDDTIEGLGGNDTLDGGNGNDAINGGDGDDVIEGGAGADAIDGGNGNDTASFAGSDVAVAIDLLAGSASGGHADGDTLTGIENLIGSGFNDTLTGDGGANVIDGGNGDDTIDGGDGDDVIEGGAGGDTIEGGLGNDTASYAGSDDAVTVDLVAGTGSGGHAAGDTLTGVENLVGSDYNDTLTGDENDNVIDGGIGEDDIVGGAGQDTIFGGNGGDNDTINVGTAGIAGRDFEVDVIVAAGSYAENGTDAVFNYDESEHVDVDNDDIFDFSEAFSFTSPDSVDWAGEMDSFLVYDKANGEIETAGDSSQVWFIVSELDATETFNPAEQVSVLVDNALFLNEGAGWTLVDDDILT